MQELSAQHYLVNQFYQAHHAWLSAWLRKKMGCAHEAADLTQDTFINLLLKDGLAQIAEPRAYLTTIAHGLMVNHIKRREIERAYFAAISHIATEHWPSSEMQAILIETLFEIDAMLVALPPNVRKAYLMLQLDGMNYAQIAESLKVSTRTVTKYIAQATLCCAKMQAILD